VLNLNTAAFEILKRRANQTAWVFAKPPPYKGPMETPRKAWAAVIARAKFDDLRIHDLRHTFAVSTPRDRPVGRELRRFRACSLRPLILRRKQPGAPCNAPPTP
jgi:integrase